LISLLLTAVYGFLLWLDGIGGVLLTQPTPMLSALAVLTFVALVAGFASPTLHGQGGAEEFEEARKERREG